ncbi:LPXTG cell wall anchor domain-containing protein [Actinoplanes sp. NPDC051411]|uniref:LPXTG cell wall anchor domain-containing protein n=1 Tax=Actinoplanes sp. NPDC051411 TaxID=3155522 RepID=UPI00342C36D4
MPTPSGRSRGESESVTDTADGLLGSGSDLTGGDIGNSGEGVTGFVSGTSDLLKSITNGGVTAPGGALGAAGSGGQGGGGPVRETSGGSSSSVAGVGLGETKTAMIADARTNAVAVGRIVDGEGALSKPLIQSAPPNSADVARHTPSGSAGPLGFGAGDLGAHARWDAAMACGNAAGEAAHSSASLKRVDLLGLLHASNSISSLSSTSLSREGGEPRPVAAATIDAGKLTLADGKIKLQVLEPPVLTASMGATTGGQVAYQPAKVKVTWPGGKSKTLTTAGDAVDISLGTDEHSSESTSLDALPKLSGLLPTSALPLPSIPGLPSLPTPDTESAPAATDGVTVRISLGDVRRATKANAVAAKASAVEIAISEGRADESDGRGKDGYGDVGSTVAAQMSLGLLEAAVVAPEAVPTNGGVVGSAALPITGPQAGLIAAGGLGLLVAGGAVLLVGRRRRRAHA